MKKNLSLVLLICLLSWFNSISQIQAPGIAWKRSDRLPAYPSSVTPIDGHTIDEEAEDWWYDHKNSYEGGGTDPGSFNGFITCGYSAIRNVTYAEDNDGCLATALGSGYYCTDDLNFCNFNFPDGVQNTPSFQTMGLYDQHGKLKWFKTYNDGWFIRVIQTSDGNYIAAGPTRSTREPDLYTPLLYNYDPTYHPNSYFGTSTCGTNYNTKINVVKIDPYGDIIWNRIYGYNYIGETDPAEDEFVPWDLVEYNIGGTPCIRVIGTASIVPVYPALSHWDGFMLDILSSDGSMNSPVQLYAPSIGNHRKFYAIEKTTISSTEYLVTVGNEELTSGELRLQVHCEDAAWNVQWTQNYGSGYGVGSGGNSYAVDLAINASNEILVPVMYECNFCYWDGTDTWADAAVFRFDISNGNLISPIPYAPISDGGSPAEVVHAYDLKIGITNTSDGGFAIVSSKVTEPFISRYPSSGVGWDCPCIDPITLLPCTDPCNSDSPYDFTESSSNLTFWNADGFVRKFLNDGTVEWSKSFDIDDELPAPFPGDQKRQECLYSITETPDGGFVVAGNDSRNFDDCYLVKLYGNCNNNLEYTFNPTNDNIYEISDIGNYLWDTYFIRGSIVIHDGEHLDIDGAILKFADTRKCGIVTNIVVEPGGVLNIYNGAILTSVDHECPYSMWDGIQLIGDNQSDQYPSTQPYFYMDNSTIENARYGVLADMALHSTHENWISPNECVIRDLAMDETQSSGGGFVSVTGYGATTQSTFHNCRFSVVLNAYLDNPTYLTTFFPLNLTM